MTPPDEPVHIQPVEAPLSDRGPRSRRPDPRAGTPWRRATRRTVFPIVMLALGAVAIYVFLYLPERVETRRPIAAAPASATDAPPGRLSSDVVAPFEAVELVRARQQAEAKLAEFVELQLVLEQQMNIDGWGAAELAAIKDRANAADRTFVEGNYQAALNEYSAATDALESLVAKGIDMFEAALAEGRAAVVALEHDRAVQAFERAMAIRPGDPDVLAGAERAAKLPAIVELLRESDRAVLRDELARAEEFLADVRNLDPATTGLAERTSRIAVDRATERRKAILSEGFIALAEGEHDRAIGAFERVLANDARDPDALAGRQQARQAKLLARIDQLRQDAEHHERADRWADALASYDAALALDATLQFARNGKTRISGRVALMDTMSRFIDDPGLLSADDEFAAAEQVLASASAETNAGKGFDEQVASLRTIVERGSVPVPLVMVSDNVTEVVIQKVGVIGTFDRSELMLRPGRYVIVGSRDGCRDVRKEITLAADTPPVAIRCVETI